MIHRWNEAVVRTDNSVTGHASLLFSFLKMDPAETCQVLQIWPSFHITGLSGIFEILARSKQLRNTKWLILRVIFFHSFSYIWFQIRPLLTSNSFKWWVNFLQIRRLLKTNLVFFLSCSLVSLRCTQSFRPFLRAMNLEIFSWHWKLWFSHRNWWPRGAKHLRGTLYLTQSTYDKIINWKYCMYRCCTSCSLQV